MLQLNQLPRSRDLFYDHTRPFELSAKCYEASINEPLENVYAKLATLIYEARPTLSAAAFLGNLGWVIKHGSNACASRRAYLMDVSR